MGEIGLTNLKGRKGKILNIQLSNLGSLYCSTLLLNYNCLEIEDFRSRILSSTKEEECVVTNLTTSSLSSSLDDVFNKDLKKTLDDVLVIDNACLCVVVAIVHSIETEFNWYYNGYNKCKKKVKFEGTKAFYERGCDMNFVLPSNKLQLRVMDEFASASFLLFDGLAYQIIGKTTLELRAQVIKDGDPNSFPEDLEVVGKKFAFVGFRSAHDIL